VCSRADNLDGSLVNAHVDRFQRPHPFHLFSTFPTIWGICSSLSAIPNALNSKRFGTVVASGATACKHTLSFSFVYDGGGMDKGGVGTLNVDGKSASTHALTAPFVALWCGLRLWT